MGQPPLFKPFYFVNVLKPTTYTGLNLGGILDIDHPPNLGESGGFSGSQGRGGFSSAY